MEKNKNGRDWAPVEQNISSLAPYNETECLATCTEETSHTTDNLTVQITEQHILLSLGERPPGTHLVDQPRNHPRLLGHENAQSDWVTSHLSEDMDYVVSSMGVFGDPWTYKSELESISETECNDN